MDKHPANHQQQRSIIRQGKIGFGILLLAVIQGVDLGLAEAAQDKQSLERVQQDIQQLLSNLDKTREQRDDVQLKLRSSEKKIGLLAKELSRLSNNIKKQKEKHANLTVKRTQLLQQLTTQQTSLAKSLRANAQYSTEQQSALKLFLQQQDAEQVNRNLKYFQYFNQAQLQQIQLVKKSLTNLSETDIKLSQQLKNLNESLENRQQQKASFNQQQQKRRTILSSLQKKEKRSASKLTKMQDNERELRKLIDRLKIPPEKSSQTRFLANLPFHKLKGKLSWPAKGKVRNRFGKMRKQGKLRWEGATINNNPGTKITAIAPGKVLFSDWMRGMGMLIIIDHGDNYMSLYAHNQSLYKEVGEPIEAGETIATMGNSGGKEKSALYFEIRRKGKPLNPGKWCKRG